MSEHMENPSTTGLVGAWKFKSSGETEHAIPIKQAIDYPGDE